MTKVERMETCEQQHQVIEVNEDTIATVCSRTLLPLELDVTYCSCCNAPYNGVDDDDEFWQRACIYCHMARPAHFKEWCTEVVTLIPLEL